MWGDVETCVSLPEPLGAMMAPAVVVCLPFFPFVPVQVLCLTSLWAAGGETVYGS